MNQKTLAGLAVAALVAVVAAIALGRANRPQSEGRGEVESWFAPGLRDARLRCLERRIRGQCSRDQPRQFSIVEQQPPFGKSRVRRIQLFAGADKPMARIRRQYFRRARVVRPSRTASQQSDEEKR